MSFLMKLPEIESLYFLDSCNGLLLFEHCRLLNPFDVVEYIVCNPATKHWAIVPVCVCCPPAKAQSLTETYLIFDPARAVSPHFHLIQFWMRDWHEEAPVTYEEITMLELSVHTYSSESGVWSHSQTDWNEQGQLEGWRHQGMLKYGWHQRTFVNGILHLVVTDLDRHQIVAVDVQGRTKKIITIPAAAQERRRPGNSYIGQSQGLLHYINQDFEAQDSRQVQSYEVSIWVLQDYDTQEWVLKDTMSFCGPFGRMTDRWDFVVIHPDHNVVFFFQQSLPKSNRLIAYDMDRKEVSVVAMASEDLVARVVPYIPYFSESPALTNKN